MASRALYVTGLVSGGSLIENTTHSGVLVHLMVKPFINLLLCLREHDRLEKHVIGFIATVASN